MCRLCQVSVECVGGSLRSGKVVGGDIAWQTTRNKHSWRGAGRNVAVLSGTDLHSEAPGNDFPQKQKRVVQN